MTLINMNRPTPPRSVTFDENGAFPSIEDTRPFYLHGNIPTKPVRSSSIRSIFHNWDSREQKNSIYSLASTLRSPNQDVVAFSSPNDPSNPMNWSPSRKTFAVMAIYLTTFSVSFSSSIFSSAVPVTTRHFGVSTELMTLSISFYVLGYAAGPLLWSPLSEAFGRRLPFITAYFFFTISQLPVAVATNPETVLVFRFLAGACGSATLVIPAAMVVDFLAPVPRSKVVGLYMVCIFMGPVLGPIAGAWMVEDRLLGWRYTSWVVLFTSAMFGIFAFFAIPESCSEILLQRKAAKLRLETQNWALHAKRDEKLVGLGALLDTYMKRPAGMILREPIVSLSIAPKSEFTS
jgi:MFS transporter, DHA1 family, multidrug resistance protein